MRGKGREGGREGEVRRGRKRKGEKDGERGRPERKEVDRVREGD